MARLRPFFLAGDLNTGPALRSPAVQSIVSDGFADALGHARTPARLRCDTGHPLDWIVVKHLEWCNGALCHHGEAPDHYPLRVPIRVPPLDPLMKIEEAAAYAKGRGAKRRYRVHVPEHVDVKAIRTKLGMTQRAFAGRFGFSINTQRHWEPR